jgi:leucyl-tRNA synthetase
MGASHVTIVVQVDGHLRGRVTTSSGTDEAEAATTARAELTGLPDARHTRRVVYVPDRLINFVST